MQQQLPARARSKRRRTTLPALRAACSWRSGQSCTPPSTPTSLVTMPVRLALCCARAVRRVVGKVACREGLPGSGKRSKRPGATWQRRRRAGRCVRRSTACCRRCSAPVALLRCAPLLNSTPSSAPASSLPHAPLHVCRRCLRFLLPGAETSRRVGVWACGRVGGWAGARVRGCAGARGGAGSRAARRGGAAEAAGGGRWPAPSAAWPRRRRPPDCAQRQAAADGAHPPWAPLPPGLLFHFPPPPLPPPPPPPPTMACSTRRGGAVRGPRRRLRSAPSRLSRARAICLLALLLHPRRPAALTRHAGRANGTHRPQWPAAWCRQYLPRHFGKLSHVPWEVVRAVAQAAFDEPGTRSLSHVG